MTGTISNMALLGTLASAVLPCLTLTAIAQDKSPRDVTVAFLEANNCRATKIELVAAFRAADLGGEATFPIVVELMNEGVVKFDRVADEVVLQTGPVCKEAQVTAEPADPEVRAAFMAMYEKKDCTLAAREGPLKVLEDTYSKRQLELALAELLNERAFRIDTAEQTTTLMIGPICGAKTQ